jgi:hypothetical protein
MLDWADFRELLRAGHRDCAQPKRPPESAERWRCAPLQTGRRKKFLYGLHDPLALNLVVLVSRSESPRSHRTAEMIGFPLIPILGSCERASTHSSLEKTKGEQHCGLFLGGES